MSAEGQPEATINAFPIDVFTRAVLTAVVAVTAKVADCKKELASNQHPGLDPLNATEDEKLYNKAGSFAAQSTSLKRDAQWLIMLTVVWVLQ